jgi:hypothetical protein
MSCALEMQRHDLASGVLHRVDEVRAYDAGDKRACLLLQRIVPLQKARIVPLQKARIVPLQKAYAANG